VEVRRWTELALAEWGWVEEEAEPKRSLRSCGLGLTSLGNGVGDLL
jgi:hypothetical protein